MAKYNSHDITVRNVDIDLLKQQRGFLLMLLEFGMISNLKHETRSFAGVEEEFIVGLINLLDAMLDNAEGYDGTEVA
jgi:hypothetical protein